MLKHPTIKASKSRSESSQLSPRRSAHPTIIKRKIGTHVNLSSEQRSSPSSSQQLTPTSTYIDSLMDGIARNDRRSLSRSITLIESTKSEHNDQANQLLRKILEFRSTIPPDTHLRNDAQWVKDEEFVKTNAIPTFDSIQQQNAQYKDLTHKHRGLPAILKLHSGKPKGPLRIGVSGTPGVGKSTFLEHLGMHLIEKYNLRVAVLSIDPSSLITGGSLLGDKTRMQRLALHDNAYIRPTPSKGILGGIAQNTAEVITLCEHANYDVIFVETVGVGQSEVQVSQVTDMLLMLMNPAGGDELQGIKKGMMEMCDIMAITKADGDLYHAACRTKADYSTAMQMYTTRSHSYGWFPRVLLSSIKEDKERYLDGIWGTILEYEHCLLQPIANISQQTLDSLQFVVERADNVGGASQDQLTSAQSQQNHQTYHKTSQHQTLLDVKRANQRIQWMWSQISQTVMRSFKEFVRNDTKTLPSIQMDLIRDLVTPRIAAQQSFDAYIQHSVDEELCKRSKH